MNFGEPGAEIKEAFEADMAALGRVAPNRDCPFCGNTSWMGTMQGSRSLVQIIPAEPGGGFSALTLICDRCGFVRLHATDVLGIGGLIGGVSD
jgi:hypothetical protein